jgi:hypothetical protein
VETSLMDIFPQNIDGIFELLYDSQVEFSRLSKERSEGMLKLCQITILMMEPS